MATCKVEHCESEAKCRGWCLVHYSRLKTRHLLDAGPKCHAPNCTKPGDFFKGYCKQDFFRLRDHCQKNGSWAAAAEREFEAFLADPPPTRPKWEYEPTADDRILAEQIEQSQ